MYIWTLIWTWNNGYIPGQNRVLRSTSLTPGRCVWSTSWSGLYCLMCYSHVLAGVNGSQRLPRKSTNTNGIRSPPRALWIVKQGFSLQQQRSAVAVTFIHKNLVLGHETGFDNSGVEAHPQEIFARVPVLTNNTHNSSKSSIHLTSNYYYKCIIRHRYVPGYGTPW